MCKALKALSECKIPLPFRLIQVLFIVLLTLFTAFKIYEGLEEESLKKVAKELGEVGWFLLIFIIYLGLLGKLFPKVKLIQQLLPLRKEAGIFLFLVLVAHGVLFLVHKGILGNISEMLHFFFQKHWAITLGVIALLLMLPAFLTSNQYAIKSLGYPLWKKLQSLVHLAFILGALHIAFVEYPEEIMHKPLIALAIYLFGYGIYFLTKK